MVRKRNQMVNSKHFLLRYALQYIISHAKYLATYSNKNEKMDVDCNWYIPENMPVRFLNHIMLIMSREKQHFKKLKIIISGL